MYSRCSRYFLVRLSSTANVFENIPIDPVSSNASVPSTNFVLICALGRCLFTLFREPLEVTEGSCQRAINTILVRLSDLALALELFPSLELNREILHKTHRGFVFVLAVTLYIFQVELSHLYMFFHKHIYFLKTCRGCTEWPKEDLHPNRESKKFKKCQIEHEEKSCQRVFSPAVASSCSYGDKIVESTLARWCYKEHFYSKSFI